jgi:hypothetical protein
MSKNSETLRHAIADLRTRNDEHAKALGVNELAVALDKSVEDLKEAARQVIRAELLDTKSRIKYATRLHIAASRFVTAEDDAFITPRSNNVVHT